MPLCRAKQFTGLFCDRLVTAFKKIPQQVRYDMDVVRYDKSPLITHNSQLTNKAVAFTLAEALIALSLVAVLAALSVVAISNSKPDESVIKFRKGYLTTVRVVNELLNDEELYPNAKEPADATTSILGNSGSIKGIGDETVTDAMRTKYPCLNDTVNNDYGMMKFPNLFAYKVNAIDSTRTAANSKTFTTPDGINWKVNREQNNNGQEGVVIFSTRGTSTYDGCIYNANTCKVPTQFRFRIYKNGRIESLDNDPMACSYIRYPKIKKASRVPMANNSCFGGQSSYSSSSGSSSGGSTSSSSGGSTSSSSGGPTSSSSGGSTSSSSGGSTSSSSGGSTSSSSGGSTSSSSGGSTSSSSGGSTSSSSGGSTSSSSGGSPNIGILVRFDPNNFYHAQFVQCYSKGWDDRDYIFQHYGLVPAAGVTEDYEPAFKKFYPALVWLSSVYPDGNPEEYRQWLNELIKDYTYCYIYDGIYSALPFIGENYLDCVEYIYQKLGGSCDHDEFLQHCYYYVVR